VTSKRAAPVWLMLLSACASASQSAVRRATARPGGNEEREHTFAFVRIEDEAIDWLTAADPRLAMRADAKPTEAVLKRVGLEAVLAEDTSAQIMGGSLDLFAFRARAQALDDAAKAVAGFRESLPEGGPVGTTIARPKLERELLERLIQEERARAADEAVLGDASGDLVRGIISTWTAPVAPQDWPDRDAWVGKHLLEIRDSLRSPLPRSGPSDLDEALYPLERLLAPTQFSRGSAGIAEVRMALDQDMRAEPGVDAPERLAHTTKVHLGVTIDPASLRPRIERIEERLRKAAEGALAASHDPRPEIEARARDLLLVERSCPAVPDTRVRSMAPPPERAAICGALRALTEEASSAAALVAVHDDVLLSFAAVTTNQPLRSRLLSHPQDEDIEALRRKARQRPVLALGVALAAELFYGTDGADERLRTWRGLGEAPLDIVAREIGVVSGP
jgi:hypothetical protein